VILMRRCQRFGGLDDLKLYRRVTAIEDQNFHRRLFIGKPLAILRGAAADDQRAIFFSVAYF
jgi:hypothetical protein